MWFMVLLSWVGCAIHIVFVVVAVAAGLYYLAELVEEYTVITKKIIFTLSVVDVCIYVCLGVFEELPLSLVGCGVVSQMLHMSVLRTFPSVSLTSPSFLCAILFFLINHALAFSYFNYHLYTFSQVLSYFTVCLWLVPFALFISLSANEYVLPTSCQPTATTTTGASGPLLGEEDVVSNYFSRKGKKYGLLSLFKYAQETLLPYHNKKSF